MSQRTSPRRRQLNRVARVRGGSTLVVVLVIAMVLVSVIALLAYYVSQRVGGTNPNQLTAVVEQGDFVHDVVESGEVESSENVEVRCEVKGRNGAGTTILSVVPEGAFVKGPHVDENGQEVPGTLLVELDKSSLEVEHQQEEIILNNKIANRDQAFNLLIAAISALIEYVGQDEFDARYKEELLANLADEAEEVLVAIKTVLAGDTKQGTFHVEEQGYQAELFLAEENLRKALQYFRYSESLAAQGYVTELQLKSDEFAVEKARKDRDAALTKLEVLRVHTKTKTAKTLTGDIYNALAVYRAEKNSVQVQDERVAEIVAQIEKCLIYAPQDGQVVYANKRDHRGNADFLVEAGATVREQQVIIRLPNSDKMQIEAKISESKISLVKEGMKATVSIDAFEDMTLDGVVTRVNQYPEPGNWFSSSIKQYETEIQIIDPPAELKSGLTAKVRIHAQHIPDATQVPIQAVHRHGAGYYCFVQAGDTWEPQQIVPGASNEKHVVIETGLEKGNVVAMNPGDLLDDVDLPAAPSATSEEREQDANLAAKYVVPQQERQREQEIASPSDTSSPNAPPQQAMSPAAIVGSIFERSDKNNDGKLTADELPERFRDNLSQTDTNGDGGIDRAEMTAAISKRMRQRPNAGAGMGAGE